MAKIIINDTIIGARLNGQDCAEGIKLNGTIVKTFAPPEPNVIVVCDGTYPKLTSLQNSLKSKFNTNNINTTYYIIYETEEGINLLREIPNKINSGTQGVFYLNYMFSAQVKDIIINELHPIISEKNIVEMTVNTYEWYMETSGPGSFYELQYEPQSVAFMQEFMDKVYPEFEKFFGAEKHISGLVGSEPGNYTDADRRNIAGICDVLQPFVDNGSLVLFPAGSSLYDGFVYIDSNTISDAQSSIDSGDMAEFFMDIAYAGAPALFMVLNANIGSAVLQAYAASGYSTDYAYICVMDNPIYDESGGESWSELISTGQWKLYSFIDYGSAATDMYNYFNEIISGAANPYKVAQLTQTRCAY